MANAALMYLGGNGTLAGDDQTGVFSAVGTGALRYAEGKFAGSQAFLVEEATTNFLANPSAEVDLTNIPALGGATVSRIADTTMVGAWIVRAACDGSAGSQGVYFRAPPGLALAGARTLTGSFFAGGAGTVNALFQFYYTDGTSANQPNNVFTFSGAWTRYVLSPRASDAAKTLDAVYLLIRTTTAQAVTFDVDAAQIEEKGYATSYTDGSLGTGYTWSGTAHASSSTRAGARVTDNNSSHIPAGRGTLAMWVRWPGEPGRTEIQSAIEAYSSVGGSTNSRVYLRRDPVSGKADVYLGDIASYAQEATASPTGIWTFYVIDWDGATGRFWRDTELRATTTTQGIINAPEFINIGSGTSGASRHSNGRIGPIMTFNRPLTAAEQSTLYQRTAPWWFGILEDSRQIIGFRGGPKRLARSMWRSTVDNVRVEDITAKVTGASVGMDIDRTIPSTLSVDLIEPSVVRPYADFLAPTVTVTEIVSGTEVTSQLGLYRAGQPSAVRHPKAVVGTVGGEDIVSLLVNSGTGAAPYNLAPGANYMAAAITQCNLAGVTRVRFPADTRTVPTGKYHSWPPGTARCRIVLDIMLILGYLPPWSDHEGYLVTRIVEDPGTQTPARSYVDGDGSDLTGEVTSDPATTTLSNHIVVTFDNLLAGTVLTAERINTDPASPASIPNIGERFRYEGMTQAADQAAVNAYANQLVEQWGNVLLHLSLTTPLDPARGYWESADVAIHANREGGGVVGRFRVAGWDHDLSAGTTSVSLRRSERFGEAVGS